MAYPNLSDLLRALTGLDLPLPLPTFGMFVALAMLAAGECLRRELRRKHAIGEIGAATVWVKDDAGHRVAQAVAPQEVVADLTVAVMIAGVLGARLFHILEHVDAFAAHPWAMIWTTSGLSIFGGLIVGTLVGLLCMRRWKLALRPALDAVAPAMMLGYALGRIGCQVSGDGDWGVAATLALKPDWLPTWFWAQTYTHNIVGELIAAPGVYPTPLYEIVMSLACCALLWRLRRHRFQAGWLFSVYLVLAGIERYAIEQIRINPVLRFGPWHATQAELIALLLIGFGALGLFALGRPAAPPRRPALGGAG